MKLLLFIILAVFSSVDTASAGERVTFTFRFTVEWGGGAGMKEPTKPKQQTEKAAPHDSDDGETAKEEPKYKIAIDEEASKREGMPMYKLTSNIDTSKMEEVPEYKERRLSNERKQKAYVESFSDDFEGNGDDRRRVRQEYRDLFEKSFEEDRARGWSPFIDKRGIYYPDAGIVW